MIEKQIFIPPLIVGSEAVRHALDCGKTKFRGLVRNDAAFPKPLPGSAPNKPQWLWASIVEYAEHLAQGQER